MTRVTLLKSQFERKTVPFLLWNLTVPEAFSLNYCCIAAIALIPLKYTVAGYRTDTFAILCFIRYFEGYPSYSATPDAVLSLTNFEIPTNYEIHHQMPQAYSR